MAIALMVRWVDKSDQPEPQERIRHIGGDSGKLLWKHTRAQAIEFIERGEFAYFVEADFRPWRLEVGRASDGRKYLTIENQGAPPQLLLNLPEFPLSEMAGAEASAEGAAAAATLQKA